jgi:MFS superfamily sulfate permease-like transporter
MAESKDNLQAGYTLAYWQHDLPASLVVFLVAMPLCMGIAIASGAPVSAGLITGIVGGMIVGLLAGAPLQVSGPAAGLSVIVYELIQTRGLEMLGVCVLAAGSLQLAAGYFRLGQWFRAVSPAVIQGMLAGIGVLIFASQFHVMLDDKPQHTGIQNLFTIPHAIYKSFPLPSLGNSAERQQATRELQRLGMLHLAQAELDESVHHLLTGIHAAAGDGSLEDHGKDESLALIPLEITTEMRAQIARELQALVPAQREIIAALGEINGSRSAERLEAAKSASAVALADLEEGDLYAARASQDQAENAMLALLRSQKNHGWAALLGLLTIMVIVAWRMIPSSRIKRIPGPLVAVVLATAAAALAALPVIYVEVPDDLRRAIYFPTFSALSGLLSWELWAFAIVPLAIIASAETLLSAAAVDQMHTGPRTNFDRELAAQGAGNLICGLLGALPMTGVIVRSSTNVQAGAKTRLSAVLHGAWLLLFVVFFAGFLRSIPTSALAAILVYTGYKLVDLKAVRGLARRGHGEVLIYAATVATIVTTDLLIGVLVGVGLAFAKLLYVFSKLEIEVERPPQVEHWTLNLRGSATFLKIPTLAKRLEQIPPDAQLHVNVEGLDYIDAACLDLLDQWEMQNLANGAKLVIDAESLQARFWRKRSGVLPQSSTNATRAGVVAPRQRQQPI